MHFEHSPRSRDLQQRVAAFMDEHVYPVEQQFHQQAREGAARYQQPPVLQRLKALARAQGLWNLFLSRNEGPLPSSSNPHGGQAGRSPALGASGREHGPGLSNLDYAPVKEIMGRVLWAPEVFNCGAPNVGNMEILARFGTPEQQARWLAPMLAGEMKSGFSMTEPEVASSDATNIRCQIRRDGDEYVINGRKWYTSDAMNEACQLLIVMGQSAPDHADPHLRQSMILVPKATPGVRIVRDIQVMGYDDAPNGHPEIVYDNVRVPAANMLLGEGRGFEIAQARLGPGRIHHCMRLVGCAQRAIELMCSRASSRIAFGKPLAEQGSVREDIARSWCEVEQARLLTLRAADKMDRAGNKAARDLIAAAKIVVPAMACQVIDRAIQIHGGAGLSQDTFLAEAYTYARFMRIGDGPDQVHLSALGKQLLKMGGKAALH